MKMRACNLKIRKYSTGGFSARMLQFAVEYKFTGRFAALLLMTALLSPLFLLKSTGAVSAASSLPNVQMPAPVSAPPESFALSSSLSSYLSGSMTNNAPSPVMALNTFLWSGYSSVSNYFTAPSLPNGFASAQPSSPFVSSVSSAVSSMSSFPGFSIGSAKPAGAAIAGSSAAIAPAAALVSQPAGSVSFDFDGDGRADVARWHPATKEWKVKRSSDGAYVTKITGTSSAALIAPGDYDGDGKTDFAVFNSGTWIIVRSSDGAIVTPALGAAGDKPAVGDYDGDGISDYAVFTPSTATWLIKNSSNGTTTTTQFGLSGDIAVAGNYDGDNRTDIAVYRPSNGYWYVQGSTAGYSTTQWGNASDIAVPADYDADGKTDKAVFRSSIGTWYVLQSSNGATLSPAWGNFGDQPVPADYDGDNKADFSVWRPTTGVWHIYKSATGAYQSESLGVPGDTAVPSAYLKQIGSQVYSYDFAKTRLSPKNAMGDTDLYSRNFSWGAGLVNLPGRAGLDFGLGISYNSLVWTKDGSTMVFDADKSSVSPGFRFGFPVIEPVYLDSATGKYNYLMVTPSGAKVEFKQQLGASNIYETADSGYAQLVLDRLGTPTEPVEFVTIIVTTTDGTQMTYAWIGNAYRCTKIKDRNGNFITIGNDEYGLLKTITDTLGRVINVNYDMDNNPISITQDWKAANGSGSTQLHTYASFNYTNVAMYANFGSLAIYGPATGNIKALQSIVYPGGSSTRFDYNVFGQVYKVSNYAADNHELNHTRVNLSNGDLPGAQTDCPRFSQTLKYAENFNNGNETVVTNSAPASATYNLPGGISGTAAMIEVAMPNHPNGAISKTYVGASGWQEGLPIATEDFADGARKRWTWTNWTQDDTNLSYIQNPRVTESKVGDATNTRRTTVGYEMQPGSSTVSRYGLVNEVAVYDANQSTVLKKSTTAYNFADANISRRIIGLPAMSRLYGENNALLSKITYNYDEGDFNDTTLNQNLTSVIQHDHSSKGYGAGFIVGRGNPTSTTRWDVNFPDNSSQAVTSSVKYNTAGGIVSQTDSSNRTVTISYADVFNDGQNSRNTFAYPTTITDPAGFSSQIKYRYDIGANVWAKSPDLNGTTPGKKSTREFDSSGRLLKQAILKDGAEYAYTRYAYPDNGTQSLVYSTITAGMGEAVSESWTDGAGRVRQSRSELPGSTGGWSATLTEYDILGRVRRQSVPTETNGSWSPAGDDLTRDFLWTSQEYDWKGRVTKETNTDGTFKTVSYEGCGCAGGQVTTIQGENIVESDWQNNNQTTLGRRTQKIYDDILGRTKKTEVMNWDGTTLYTTTVNTFNGRDQTVLSRQYAGAEGGSSFQDVMMSYDGHGRIKTQHRPEQDANTSTTYNYNADDSIQSVVDARGASSNYTYNSRGLVEQISYGIPGGSTIPAAPSVAFGYDNIGNRISMTDGLGTVSYAYNELSQMTSETRAFTDALANAPLSNNSFKLEYDYTLSGQLKSLKDPYGQQFNYSYDKTGRLSSVAGSTSFAGIATYAGSAQYNARGTLTGLSYGNGASMAITGFNAKLQATDFEIKKGATSIIKKQYQFYDDGSLKFSKDVNEQMFDRLYKYDHLGRTVEAKSGANARGGTDTAANIPYKQNFGYNAFGNITQSTMETYASGQTSLSYTFTNNRNSAATYDANGKELSDENAAYQFDTAGRTVKTQERESTGSANFLAPALSWFDGAGQETKRIKNYVEGGNNSYGTSYFIRSSVTGKIVSEANSTGEKWKTFVSANGATLAEQIWGWNGYNREEFVNFYHQDASGASLRLSDKLGSIAAGDSSEYDALGNNVGLSNPYETGYEPPPPDGELNTGFGDVSYRGGGGSPIPATYLVNGLRVSASEFAMWADTASIGGMFGILERNARMSAPRYTVFDVYGLPVYSGTDWGQARQNAFQTETMIVYRTFNESWSLNLSLFSFNQRPQAQQQSTPYSNVAGLRTELQRRLNLNSGECRNKLNELLKALGKKFDDKVSKTTGFDALIEMFLGGVNRVLEKTTGYSNYNSQTKSITMNVSADRGAGFLNSIQVQGIEFIHELLHGASNSYFSHGDIVKKIAKIEGLNFDKLKNGQETEDKNNGKTPNDSSTFEAPMNAWLNRYCGGKATAWNDFYQRYKKS